MTETLSGHFAILSSGHPVTELWSLILGCRGVTACLLHNDPATYGHKQG